LNGGIKVEKQKKQYKRFSEVTGVNFYADIPKLPLADILDTEYLIKDVEIIENFNSKFGKSSFALLLLEDNEKNQVTTICGGMVIVEKCRKVLKDNLLPLYGTIQKIESEEGNEYYDIK
jgi:hypothetical protein